MISTGEVVISGGEVVISGIEVVISGGEVVISRARSRARRDLGVSSTNLCDADERLEDGADELESERHLDVATWRHPPASV